MQVTIVTIFPELCTQVLAHSLLAKALEESRVEIDLVNIRDFASEPHRAVDDYPFGGGAGMVMKPEPLVAAIESVPVVSAAREVILLSPQGEKLAQSTVDDLASREQLVLVCGRYEGVDERVRQGWITREISIGDYVLMGGELPALVLIEAVVRKLRGVIGNPASLAEESFALDWLSAAEVQEITGMEPAVARRLLQMGILEYPQYTRPRRFRDMEVPRILLSGHHQQITSWRKLQAVRRTLQRRREFLDHLKAAGAPVTVPGEDIGGNTT